MRQTVFRVTLAASMAVILIGCAKKETQTVASATSDSLISSNPVEVPNGSLAPQRPFEPSTAPPHRTRTAAPTRRHVAAPEPAPQQAQEPQTEASSAQTGVHQSEGVVVEWGSFLHVVVSDAISSETAHPGDAWSGTLADSVFVRDRVALPAGSLVHGIVKEAKPAKAGDRALLALEVTSVDAFGNTYPVSATMDPIVPGSPRARNLGAIAGSAAAGALIGSAVGGGKGSVIGGLIGGAAAGGAVARSKGFEAVVKPGSRITFTLAKDAVVRR